MQGKRGCALKMAFTLHVLGFVALLIGCLTPFWSREVDKASGEVQFHEGLLVSYSPDGQWLLRNFNVLMQASSDETILYLTLSISFAMVSIFLQLFLVQTFALVLCNASCGRRYNPDWLLVFSLLSGIVATTSLILFEQYTGRNLDDSSDVTMDYSRGFVIIFIAAVFLSAFFLICDRTDGKK